MTPPHIEKAARLIVESNMRNTHLRLMSKGRTWVIDKAKWPAMVEENWSDPEVRAEAIESATLVWSLARAHTIEEAAKVADAYAEENIMMAQDSIINDPLLSKLCGLNMEVTVTNADFDASESMIVDGTIHSSMFHAAQNIAAAIRALSVEQTRPSPSSEE